MGCGGRLGAPVDRQDDLCWSGWLSQPRADDAVDAVLILTSHETYTQLCLERGWDQDRYITWLVAHLWVELS